jgi:hypothetical protein
MFAPEIIKGVAVYLLKPLWLRSLGKFTQIMFPSPRYFPC